MPKKKVTKTEETVETPVVETVESAVEAVVKPVKKSKKAKEVVVETTPVVAQEDTETFATDLTAQQPNSSTAEVKPEGVDSQQLNDLTTEQPVVKKKVSRTRSARYQAARSQIDKTKSYDVAQAVELLKKLSYTKFDGSIEAHVQLKEVGLQATVTLPHSTGKSINVAIFDEEIGADLTKGVVNFDILLAKPADMKNLAKFARLLGPKGLMPNPKNGTVTANPEARKKELEGGAMTVKTERKAPLMHVVVGKVSMKPEQVVANVEALLKPFTGKILRMYLTASMSPSVRVTV